MSKVDSEHRRAERESVEEWNRLESDMLDEDQGRVILHHKE